MESTMKLRNLIAGGALAVLASACASAQDKERAPSASPSTGASGAAAGSTSAARGSVPLQQNQTRQQLFDKLDSNQSGSISRGEAQESPPLLLIFIEMDANTDGELSAAEFSRVPLVNPDGTSAP
jgi:hypothetical protein